MLPLDRQRALHAFADARTLARRRAAGRSPGFSPQESDAIAAWSAEMQGLGVTTEITVGHTFLSEALHVMREPADEPWWIVHKTPDGACAVRLWPGLADIVPTVPRALSIIAQAVDRWRAGSLTAPAEGTV